MRAVVGHWGSLTAAVLLAAGIVCAPGRGWAAGKDEKLRQQYNERLQKLAPGDEAGYERLARWCEKNKLRKEAEETWTLLLRKKRDAVAGNPSVGGYQALARWCKGAGRKQDADVAERDALRLEYGTRKGALKPDDADGMRALADWCRQRKLTAEAAEIWHGVVRLQPTNAYARAQMEAAAAASWLSAPTGLLKNQSVPGYTNAAAWYHVSVPKEYDGKKALPLIVYLHGGAHEEGCADNVVALAQVMPPFKKAIVVFPNHLRTWWAHPREMTYLVDTVEQVLLRWRVDRRRVYLMGASMGGNGVWAFGSRCPEMFAAVSPIAAFYAAFLQFPLNNLSSKPVYVLHGTKDGTVPISGAREAYALLKKAGATIEMREVDCGHQPPTEELTKATEWLFRYSNKEEFDMAALRERVSKVPVPGWLKKYPGN